MVCRGTSKMLQPTLAPGIWDVSGSTVALEQGWQCSFSDRPNLLAVHEVPL